MSTINAKNKLEKNLESRMNKLLSEKRFGWDLEKLLVYNIEFPEDEYSPKKSSDAPDKNFNQFLKKLNWLLNLQFYYSIRVIKLKKRQRLVYFLRMYLTTQKEIVRLLHDMYYKLDTKEQYLVYDYMDVPRLEKEIDGISTVITKQWNEPKELLSEKEMLGLVEEVGDSVKDPLKKVFGGVGNWINENIRGRHTENNQRLWSGRNQGKINSGIKYLDEFGNIGMRMARGGL